MSQAWAGTLCHQVSWGWQGPAQSLLRPGREAEVATSEAELLEKLGPQQGWTGHWGHKSEESTARSSVLGIQGLCDTARAFLGFPVAQMVKNPPAMWETWV